MSKRRTIIDGTYIVYQRSMFEEDDWLHYMLVDSSVQYARRFEVVCLMSIRCAESVKFYRMAKALVELLSVDDPSIEDEDVAKEIELMQSLEKALVSRERPK